MSEYAICGYCLQRMGAVKELKQQLADLKAKEVALLTRRNQFAESLRWAVEQIPGDFDAQDTEWQNDMHNRATELLALGVEE